MSLPTHFVPNKDDIRHGYECEVRREIYRSFSYQHARNFQIEPEFREDYEPVVIGISRADAFPENDTSDAAITALFTDLTPGAEPVHYSTALHLLKHEMIRTPYLTKDAIFSEGWEFGKRVSYPNEFSKGRYTLEYDFREARAHIHNGDEFEGTYFVGAIKCINDLRLIERMIGIRDAD